MIILDFIGNNWMIITFIVSTLSTLIGILIAIIEGIKCSLRNDILTIYDRCKEKQQITYYELEAIMYSYKIYKILNGNSFVKEIIDKVKEFELID